MKTEKSYRPRPKARGEALSLDLIPDPFIIIRMDGRVQNANHSFLSLVKMQASDIVDKEFTAIPLLSDLSAKVNQSLASEIENSDRVGFFNRYFEVLILPFRSEDGSRFVRVALRDITNFVRLEKELLKRNKELIIVNTLSSAFISSENMDLVMEDLMEKVLLITDFHTGWIMMTEDEQFRLKASRGISQELQEHIAGGGLATLCADALHSEDPLHVVEPTRVAESPVLCDEGISFLVIVPLVSSYHAPGLLYLASSSGRELDFDFAALLSLVGNHVSHIIDKIRLFQETKRLSITDGLTGLFNSRYFYKHLGGEIARSRRYGNFFSLMLFDIDDFKRLNDTFGHQAGDEVLQELARMLKSVSRETDIVVRYGGEEFIIILPNTGEEEAFSLARRILQVVQNTMIRIGGGESVNITLSGGIATFPKNAISAKALLNAADSAMYAAKAAGKNTIICFDGVMHEKNL